MKVAFINPWTMFKLFFCIIKNHSMNGIHAIPVLMKGAVQPPPEFFKQTKLIIWKHWITSISEHIFQNYAAQGRLLAALCGPRSSGNLPAAMMSQWGKLPCQRCCRQTFTQVCWQAAFPPWGLPVGYLQTFLEVENHDLCRFMNNYVMEIY